MHLRILHVVISDKILLFLWLNNIPVYMCIYILHFLYEFIHRNFCFFCVLAIINNVAGNMGCLYPFELVYSLSSDKYPQRNCCTIWYFSFIFFMKPIFPYWLYFSFCFELSFLCRSF